LINFQQNIRFRTYLKKFKKYLFFNKKMASFDYNNSTSGSRNMYASLNNYSSNYSMDVPPQGKVITGQYIVPTYDAIGYESLTARVPNPSGYSDINTAYGKDAATCQTNYRTSLCSGASYSGASGYGNGMPAMTGAPRENFKSPQEVANAISDKAKNLYRNM